MNAKTLQKRIAKNLYTTKGKLKQRYDKVIYWLLTDCNKVIYPCHWDNGWSKLIDNSEQYLTALNLLGIDFEEGNDAPKGGSEGYFIRLTAKGKRQIKDYINYNNQHHIYTNYNGYDYDNEFYKNLLKNKQYDYTACI